MEPVSVDLAQFPYFPDPVEHCIGMSHGPLRLLALAAYVPTEDYPEMPGVMYHSEQEWFSKVEGDKGTYIVVVYFFKSCIMGF